MARCENCIHQKVCLHMANIQNDTYAYMGVNFNVEACEHYSQTEDVVEVVRCKDCKHCERGICYYPKVRYVSHDKNHFCGYGERKEHGT